MGVIGILNRGYFIGKFTDISKIYFTYPKCIPNMQANLKINDSKEIECMIKDNMCECFSKIDMINKQVYVIGEIRNNNNNMLLLINTIYLF